MLDAMHDTPATTPQTPRAQRYAAQVMPCGDFVVRFEWIGDRWSHRVLVDGATVLESIEGPWPPANDPRWPASPAIVELDRVDLGDGPAIVGLGLAGRSHYSVTFTVDRRDTARLLVQAACRLHEQAGWVGSTYKQPDAPPARSPRIEPLPGCTLERGSGLIRLRAGDGSASGPATVAWGYHIGPS